MKKIIDITRWGRADEFDVVTLKELPDNYFVWNIGRANFPHPDYLPFAKAGDLPYNIDRTSLKTVKMPNEDIALGILKLAGQVHVTKADVCALLASRERGTYTMDDWKRDGTFKAAEGQEVDVEVVEQMRDCVPPLTWGGGLLQVGEAYDVDRTTGATLYTTFEMIGGKWYFRGHKPARRY